MKHPIKKKPETPKGDLLAQSHNFNESNLKDCVGQIEIPLIEQVRRRRSELSEKYQRQLSELNQMERTLLEREPEEIIAAIKDNLRNIEYPF